MRALITGAGGFVGKWLERELLESNFEVACIDHDVDVTDRKQINKAIEKSDPEIIYHLAAFSHVGTSWVDPVEVARVNSLGTYQVVNSAAELNSDIVVVVVSSAEVYGKVSLQDLPITENHEVRPFTPYGASKAASELFALQLHYSKNAKVVIVRPFNHVGPGQSDRFVVSALAKRLVVAKQTNVREIVVGNIDSRRDYLDVRDVVKAYRMLTNVNSYGQTFNLCSGTSYSVREIIEKMQEIYEYHVELKIDPALVRASDIPELRGSYEKLHLTTGWQPSIAFEKTLQDTLSYWEKSLEHQSIA